MVTGETETVDFSAKWPPSVYDCLEITTKNITYNFVINIFCLRVLFTCIYFKKKIKDEEVGERTNLFRTKYVNNVN